MPGMTSNVAPYRELKPAMMAREAEIEEVMGIRDRDVMVEQIETGNGQHREDVAGEILTMTMNPVMTMKTVKMIVGVDGVVVGVLVEVEVDVIGVMSASAVGGFDHSRPSSSNYRRNLMAPGRTSGSGVRCFMHMSIRTTPFWPQC